MSIGGVFRFLVASDSLKQIAKGIPLPGSLTREAMRGIKQARQDNDELADVRDPARRYQIVAACHQDREHSALKSLWLQFYALLFLLILPGVWFVALHPDLLPLISVPLALFTLLVNIGFTSYSIRNHLSFQPGRERRRALLSWLTSPSEWSPHWI